VNMPMTTPDANFVINVLFFMPFSNVLFELHRQ